MEKLSITLPVLVAPSTSGPYLVSYMMAYARKGKVAGYVALAPTDYDRWRPMEYTMIQVSYLCCCYCFFVVLLVYLTFIWED